MNGLVDIWVSRVGDATPSSSSGRSGPGAAAEPLLEHGAAGSKEHATQSGSTFADVKPYTLQVGPWPVRMCMHGSCEVLLGPLLVLGCFPDSPSTTCVWVSFVVVYSCRTSTSER